MKAWKTYLLAVLATSFISINGAYADDIGELDTTFGDDGVVITSFGDFGDRAYAVALQSDGKILAAGSSSNGFDQDLAIARYNEDGSLDTTFSDDGKLKTSLGDGDEELTAVAVQDDGYIVAAGYTVVDGGRDFVLVRFTQDGHFDNSFGEGGMVITEFGNLDDEITAIFIDEEGRIFACGYVTGTAGRVVTVARYKKNGDLDILFGDEGVVLIDVGGDALANSIDVDADGKIVLAGSYDHADRTELMVLRLLENGDLDTGFGRDGIAVPADDEMASEGFGVRFMEDGSIMAAGSIGKPGDLDAAVFRFTEAGQPDTTFGDEGVLVTSAGDEDDTAYAIDVLDNVIGLSGYNTFNTKQDFLFVSIEETSGETANVSLNLNTGNFPAGGKRYSSVFDLSGQEVEPVEGETTEKTVFTSTAIGASDDVSYAVVLQADGKAISAGSSKQQDGVSNFAVARYITPVANALAESGTAAVSWITTREPTNVNRTGAYSGGTIFADGLTIEKRGVVFSVTPDPVYKAGQDGTDPDDGAADTTAPTLSNGSPSGEQASGTTSITMAVNTNENASCRYSQTSGTDYNSMTDLFSGANTTSHSVLVDSLADGESYTFYVRCEDVAGNANTSDFTISFSVRIGPNITASSPSGELPAGTADTTLEVTTDEDATCRYSATAGTDYASMTDFGTTGTTTHSELISSLVDGTSYSYYVRCEDTEGNTNTTDFTISFSVAAAARLPLSVNTVSLKIFDFSDTAYSVDTSYLTGEHSPQADPVEAGPVISNGSPYGKIAAGSSMTYIGVYTDERADCMYSQLPGLDFDSMSELMATADHLSHIAKVTGLQNEYSYTYYVRCRDFAGSENGEDYRISFSVASAEDTDVGPFRRLTKNISNFLVAIANAQETVIDEEATTPDSDSGQPTSVFDLSAPEYVTEGSTDDGGGGGSYSSVLENLKPGTFYYVRAYAVDDNGDVYYGNQLGFKTADSCFVATAAYGTLLHPYVKVLRSFRDQYLVTNVVGRALVNLYYHYSPPVAKYIAARPFVRGVARLALLPFIGMSWLVLNIGFAGLGFLALLLIMPSMLVCRSYGRQEKY